jgi:hypothetical protein
VQPDGTVKVGDAGLCRRAERGVLQLPRPIGARGYVSPEMMAKQPVTARSDIAGFGRFYCVLVTGKRPSQRADGPTLAEQVRAAGAEPWEVELVRTCCAEKPDERPASMDEVAARLA